MINRILHSWSYIIEFNIDRTKSCPLRTGRPPWSLIFSALNRSSTRRCGFESRSGHRLDKPNSACGWSGGYSRWSPVFAPSYNWIGSKWNNLDVYVVFWRLLCTKHDVKRDQDQDNLLVKRRNDNHSTGPVIRELVPSSHQRSELSNTILCIFSGWDQRIGEGIPIPDSLGEEATFINIWIGNGSLKCHRVLIPVYLTQSSKRSQC